MPADRDAGDAGRPADHRDLGRAAGRRGAPRPGTGRGAAVARRRRAAARCPRDCRAQDDGAPHALPRRRSRRLLRTSRRRSRPRLGLSRRRPDAAQRHGVRGCRQDRVHDELHLVGDGAHDRRPGPAPRRAGSRRAAGQPGAPRLSDGEAHGGDGGGVLPRRRPGWLPRTSPAAPWRPTSRAAISIWKRSSRPRSPICPTTKRSAASSSCRG